MRVTDLLAFQSARTATAQAREAAESAQQLVSTGTRIQTPGDDPAGSGLVVAFAMSSDRLGAIGSAAAAASDELNAADGALDGVSTALSRARELAVQFASSTYSSDQRAMGAVEVGTLVQQVIADLNTQFGNRYIFGGTKDDAPPFQADGTYVGDSGVRQVEVAPGVYQQANVRADVAIAGAAGGVNVIATLQALQTALTSNDVSGVQSTLNGIDASIDQVATGRAQAGASMSALDAAQSAAKLASGNDKTLASKQGEVDLADAAIQLQATQNALQATLAATAQSFKMSLLDYLG